MICCIKPNSMSLQFACPADISALVPNTLTLNGDRATALAVLRQLKQLVSDDTKDDVGDKNPQLYRSFDIIQGTGCGGLLAIMLMELKMVTH
jgi:hypothetical protein